MLHPLELWSGECVCVCCVFYYTMKGKWVFFSFSLTHSRCCLKNNCGGVEGNLKYHICSQRMSASISSSDGVHDDRDADHGAQCARHDDDDRDARFRDDADGVRRPVHTLSPDTEHVSRHALECVVQCARALDSRRVL